MLNLTIDNGQIASASPRQVHVNEDAPVDAAQPSNNKVMNKNLPVFRAHPSPSKSRPQRNQYEEHKRSNGEEDPKLKSALIETANDVYPAEDGSKLVQSDKQLLKEKDAKLRSDVLPFTNKDQFKEEVSPSEKVSTNDAKLKEFLNSQLDRKAVKQQAPQ